MHLRARTVLLVSAALAVAASSAAPALAAPGPALSHAATGDQSLTWSIVPSPNANAINNVLSGVSCASASDCTAVGWHVHTTGGPSRTLIESWNGTTWSIVPSRNPRSVSSLNDVSCVSASDCTAVGSDTGAGIASKTLVESWNGTTWTVVPSPNAASHRHDTNDLNGVSCVSASNCTAVGSYMTRTGHPRTLIESWNGTTWTIVPSPNPGPATSGLGSVSCTSATACTAVGSYLMRKGGGRVEVTTLAESWNGTTWSIVPSPNTGPTVSALQGVSCATATACIAVGYSQTKTRALSSTLIESWNGTT